MWTLCWRLFRTPYFRDVSHVCLNFVIGRWCFCVSRGLMNKSATILVRSNVGGCILLWEKLHNARHFTEVVHNTQQSTECMSWQKQLTVRKHSGQLSIWILFHYKIMYVKKHVKLSVDTYPILRYSIRWIYIETWKPGVKRWFFARFSQRSPRTPTAWEVNIRIPPQLFVSITLWYNKKFK